jgi:large subunit ribosomal protein L18e
MALAGLERKTDPHLKQLIVELRKIGLANEAPIWSEVAERLSKPSKNWAHVNVEKVQDVAGTAVAVVCGKVLSTGQLTQPVQVAAVRFSENARKKISEAKGKTLDLLDVARKHPKGTGVMLVA